MVSIPLRVMREIFTNVQFNKTSHQSFLTKLRKYYEKFNFDEFVEAFIECLRVPMTYGEKDPHVENTLDFAAKFAVSLRINKEPDENDDTEQMCPFLTALFDFLLEHHPARSSSVRFRVCHFLNMLLNSMGDDAFIDDTLCDKITTCMTERLLDRSPKVRAQAVFALHRLQDPTDDNDTVIRMYIFHLSKDPNVDVRKAVLSVMAKSQKTLQAVLKRTRDVNETVRKMAYQFISKITVRSLTIKQREGLLNDGLKDRSELVSKTVRNILLPSWLQHLDGEYTKLLRSLDAESATETAILGLNALLKRTEVMKLMQQLPVDPDTKLIPVDKLTSESALYWRCLIEHFYKESCTEQLEQCLPELTNFCHYIREYLGMLDSREDHPSATLSELFILYQLFEIAKTFDLADENGRTTLMQLILDTLLSDNCSERITECIAKYIERVMPDVDARLNALAHVISEIRMPTNHYVATQVPQADTEDLRYEKAQLTMKLLDLREEEYQAIQKREFLKAQELKENIEELVKKIDEMSNRNKVLVADEGCKEKNDPKTMIRCLTITLCMIAAPSVKTLTSTLRSLVDNLVLPSVDHADNRVHIIALKAMGIFCLLDEQMAKSNIMMFFLQFSLGQENQSTWVTALKSIFDLLLNYGFECFDMGADDIVENDTTEVSERRRSRSIRLYNAQENEATGVSLLAEGSSETNINFVKILTSLLDNADQELRTTATEGLCKLILHGKIKGSHLISRLLILLHNPTTEDDTYLRQCLCVFFKTYVSRVPESGEMMELAFMPTLKTLANAPETSPLPNIEPTHVAKFIIDITCSRNHRLDTENYNVHNNIALSILAEALDRTTEIDMQTLLKSLTYLDMRFDDNVMKENIWEAVNKIEVAIDESDRRLKRYITQFRKKFEVPEEAQQEGPVINEEAIDFDAEE